jgi:hypothetical protein
MFSTFFLINCIHVFAIQIKTIGNYKKQGFYGEKNMNQQCVLYYRIPNWSEHEHEQGDGDGPSEIIATYFACGAVLSTWYAVSTFEACAEQEAVGGNQGRHIRVASVPAFLHHRMYHFSRRHMSASGCSEYPSRVQGPALIEFAASDNQVPDDQEEAQSAGCIEHIFRRTFPLRCLLQLLIAAPNVLCCKEGIGHELVDVCGLRCQVANELCLQLRYLYQRLLSRSAKLISTSLIAGADRHT